LSFVSGCLYERGGVGEPPTFHFRYAELVFRLPFGLHFAKWRFQAAFGA